MAKKNELTAINNDRSVINYYVGWKVIKERRDNYNNRIIIIMQLQQSF